MSEIARTKRRLAPSTSFYIITGTINTKTIASGTLTGVTRIGAIKSWREGNPRMSTPQYEFDADNPGEIDERTPNLADKTINISRAVLYTGGDLLEAVLGTNGTKSTGDIISDLVDQVIPFSLLKIEKYPTSTPKIPDRVTIYSGCLLHDNPKTYEMSGDLVVIQEAEIGYVKKVTT